MSFKSSRVGKLTFSVALSLSLSLQPERLPALHHLIVSHWVANGVRFNWVKAWTGRNAAPVHTEAECKTDP